MIRLIPLSVYLCDENSLIFGDSALDGGGEC